MLEDNDPMIRGEDEDPWSLSVSQQYRSYDPQTEMVTLTNGVKMAREEYEKLAVVPGQVPAPLPRVQGARHVVAPAHRFKRDLEYFQQTHQDRGTVDKTHLAYLLKSTPMHNTVVMWRSKNIFTYVAVFAGGDWYISGKGDWYGKNQFTKEEFIDQVVTHDEVTSIALVTELELLWER